MKIGYARVSTVGQDYETQKELLEIEGCERLFVEKVTATSTKHRVELKNALEFAREGDTLVVTKIDRLARSITDLNKIIKGLEEKGVNVHFLKEGLEFKADGSSKSTDILLFNVLGSFAQFEAELIRERTSEGRARAIQEGKKMGRPGQDEKDIKRAMKLYNNRESNGMSVADIVKVSGIPRSTIYSRAREQRAMKQAKEVN